VIPTGQHEDHIDKEIEETLASSPSFSSPSAKARVAEKRARLRKLQLEVEEKRQKLQSLAAQQRVAKRSFEEFTVRLRQRQEDLEDVVYKFEELTSLPPLAPTYTMDASSHVKMHEDKVMISKLKEKKQLIQDIETLTRAAQNISSLSPPHSNNTSTCASPERKMKKDPKATKSDVAEEEGTTGGPRPGSPNSLKAPSRRLVQKIVKVRKEVMQPAEPEVRTVYRWEGYAKGCQEYLAHLNKETENAEQRVQGLLSAIEAAELRMAGDKNAVRVAACERDLEKIGAAAASFDQHLQEHQAYCQNAEAVLAKLTKHSMKLERKLQEGKTENHEMQAALEAINKELNALQDGESQEGSTLAAARDANAALTKEIQLLAIRVEGAAAEFKGELQAAILSYKKEEQRRRELYNEVQELKGNIRVYCRMKPRSSSDQVDFIRLYDDMNLDVYDEISGRDTRYEFDMVLAEDASQEMIFQEVQPLAMSILDGYHVCIFAYGQTGSGKTYTMEGPPHNRGVNVRAVDELFRVIESRKGDYTYSIEVSVLEVYNDVAYDLQNKRMKLEVRHSEKTGVVIEGLVRVPALCTDGVVDVLTAAYSQRVAKETKMNERSSRSHCIVSLYITGVNLTSQQKIIGKLHMIDLAGSERVKQSEVTGDRLKEATCINQSLTSLGLVIRALASKKDHIPYRDSKLTSLLQDSLGGNCKCLMFANISMANSNVTETISTLKFATNARKVELGKATANKS
jgi:kinesin family protein C2/C3